MILFMGDSFAANTLREAAKRKGLILTEDPEEAHLIFISQDAEIQSDGRRNLSRVLEYIDLVKDYGAILVLTSQVPPGVTRSLGLPIYHQPETLRIKDAMDRALYPEQIIVGCEHPEQPLPKCYLNYLAVFNCPIFQVTWEEAEFSKIAINMTLASQVENTNRLAAAASKIGADWNKIIPILKHDRRIGPHSYLEPGDWKQSQHLLRDYVTLKDIESGR